jgi:hypothetical protein
MTSDMSATFVFQSRPGFPFPLSSLIRPAAWMIVSGPDLCPSLLGSGGLIPVMSVTLPAQVRIHTSLLRLSGRGYPRCRTYYRIARYCI